MKYDLLALAQIADDTNQRSFAEALRWAHEQISAAPPPEPPAPVSAIDLTVEFNSFYRAYPRKVGRPAATTKFKAARRKASFEAIMAGLERWRDYWEARGQPEYIPHPATWLHQERWNDPTPTTAARGEAVNADRLQQDALDGLRRSLNGASARGH